MARIIFLLLLLINLGVLAGIYFKADEQAKTGREPQRVKMELAADKIRIVSPDDIISLSATAISPVAAATPALDVVTCHAYMGATLVEAQQITKTWTAKLPGAIVVANPIPSPPVFDIAIAGLATRSAAETKVGELKKLGVTNTVSIRADDDKRYSVLMDTFAERKAAEEALKGLGKKGVRSAAVIERQPAAEKSNIEVRGTDAALKKLPELVAALKSLSPTPCDAVSSAP